eukprot:4467212-Lingulodinium_polyedra.AAC.1
MACLLGSLKVAPEAAGRVKTRMLRGRCLGRLGLSRHRLDAAAETHSSTWSNVGGCGGHALTGKSSRAGDPWGDFVFNVVALAVAEETSAEFHAKSLA